MEINFLMIKRGLEGNISNAWKIIACVGVTVDVRERKGEREIFPKV